MGLRTHEKRPLFLLRDLGKPVNTAASYYEMSLAVKPDLSLRSSFPFRVARAKQSARKGAGEAERAKRRERRAVRAWLPTLYPNGGPKWRGFSQANQTLPVKCGTLNEGILLTHLSPGCVISQLGETSSQPVVWGLCRETRETTVFSAPGEGTTTWKMFKYYYRKVLKEQVSSICHLKNEKETVTILAIAGHFRCLCFRCYCYHGDDLRLHVFLSLGHIVADNKVVLNSTS